MFKQLNLNPLRNSVGDCVIRAISAATSQPWEYVYMCIAVKGYELADMPSMRILDYKERTAPTAAVNNPPVEYITRQDFDALTARVEALAAKPSRKAKEVEE